MCKVSKRKYFHINLYVHHGEPLVKLLPPFPLHHLEFRQLSRVSSRLVEESMSCFLYWTRILLPTRNSRGGLLHLSIRRIPAQILSIWPDIGPLCFLPVSTLVFWQRLQLPIPLPGHLQPLRLEGEVRPFARMDLSLLGPDPGKSLRWQAKSSNWPVIWACTSFSNHFDDLEWTCSLLSYFRFNRGWYDISALWRKLLWMYPLLVIRR